MMTKKHIIFILIALAIGFLALFFFGSESQPQKELPEVTSKAEPPDGAIKDEPNDQTFADDPAARAQHDKMIETMCNTESISYKSDFRFEAGSKLLRGCTYLAWMKKPNYIRLETLRADGGKAGVLIGDGNDLWIYWPGGRPHFSNEDRLGESSAKKRMNVYMKEAMPTGEDSIRYKTSRLGGGMGVPVIDPSTFHGYGHMISLKSHLYGFKKIGTEKIGKIKCDMIELHHDKIREQKYQFWISKEDHLPRKLKRIMIRKNDDDLIIEELWSDVMVNLDIPAETFAWTPPEGWSRYNPPDPK